MNPVAPFGRTPLPDPPPARITSFKKPPYEFLSNFYPCRVWYEGRQYISVEHAYQAAKCADPEDGLWIQGALTAGSAKRRGRGVALRRDWDDVRLFVMSELLRSKFKYAPLCAWLLATGNAELVEENTWGDRFWGVYRGRGENWLGKLLMQVREELQEQ